LLLMMAAPADAGGAGPDSENARVPDPMKAVRRFARSCGYEQNHSLHVAKLALEIFDQLGEPLQRQVARCGVEAARSRQLLEAAAVLHDIGYLINYTAHHKHAYHLIVHAELPGWTPAEVRV